MWRGGVVCVCARARVCDFHITFGFCTVQSAECDLCSWPLPVSSRTFSNFTLMMTVDKQRAMSALLNSGYKIGTKQRVLLVGRLTVYFLNSVVKTFQWHYISLGFHPLFCLFLSLSWPREVLPIAFRKCTNTHASFFECAPFQSAHSSKRKHLLGVSGVLCIYLVSYCFKQMPFSLIGVISIAAGRHRGCLASPRINKGTLCKWPLETMAGPLIGFHGAGSGQCSTSHGWSVLFSLALTV